MTVGTKTSKEGRSSVLFEVLADPPCDADLRPLVVLEVRDALEEPPVMVDNLLLLLRVLVLAEGTAAYHI